MKEEVCWGTFGGLGRGGIILVPSQYEASFLDFSSLQSSAKLKTGMMPISYPEDV
jgi:hypothetical protein